MFPLLPPPRRRLRGGGRRGKGAQTAPGHQIFWKNLPGAALLPESTRNRMVTTAAQRLPARGFPHCGHCPHGTPASIGASYALIISKRSSARTYLARRTERSTPNSVANSAWQRAEARNRSHVREPDAPSRSYPRPHHQVDTSDHSRSWAPQPRDSATRLAPAVPYHRAPEPRDHRATRYDLDHLARGRRHEAQRSQASAAVPLGGHTFAPKPRSDYQKRATSPPVRSRHPPVHTISDFDSSDAEARPNGLTPCARHHARLLSERRILSWDAASAAPPDSRNPHTATTSQSRLQPIHPNLNPRRRETRLMPGLPRQ